MIPTNPSCTGRHGSLALASACHAEKKTLLSTPRLKGYSSVGRAAVSKTAGRGFEPCCPCQKPKKNNYLADGLIFQIAQFAATQPLPKMTHFAERLGYGRNARDSGWKSTHLSP